MPEEQTPPRSKSRCVECGGPVQSTAEGELVCRRCGLVYGGDPSAAKPDPQEYLGRQLVNPAVWHWNLGSPLEEVQRTLRLLRRRGFFRLTARDKVVVTLTERLGKLGYTGEQLDRFRRMLLEALSYDGEEERLLREIRRAGAVRDLSPSDVLNVDDPLTREAIATLVAWARRIGWSETQTAEAARNLRKLLKKKLHSKAKPIVDELVLEAMWKTAEKFKIPLTR